MQRRVFLFVGALLLLLGTTPAASGADAVSHMLMFDPDNGQWFMNDVDGSVDSFYYGTPGDVPLVGDWDCDGQATIGAYRRSNGFVYVRNSNDQGLADHEFFFGGVEGDVPITGDWDGDGCDTVSIYRDGQVFISNALDTQVAEYSFYWGLAGDTPFGGDFDGDGIDTVGSYRASSGFVYLRNELATGVADQSFFYGIPGDTILAGDWDEDGVDTVGIYRPSEQRFYLSNDNVQGPADIVFEFASTDGWLAAGRATPGFIFDVAISPGEDIQAAVDANPPGTTFLIRTGIHRLQEVLPKDGQVFVGEPGAVLSGAVLLNDWQPNGSWWSVDGQTQRAVEFGLCADGVPRCGHSNDLFVDDVTYEHVGSLADLGPGKWFFDYGANRIYLGEDPAGRRVETSVAERAFHGSAAGVRILDLIVEKYANRAQLAAVDSRVASNVGYGSGWIVDGVEARLNHGVGINVTNGGVARNNFAHHNGQLGLSAQGNDVLIEGNEISYNNTAGFHLDWEAGGTKFATTVNAVVRGNYVHDNHGLGLWVDVSAVNTIIEDNRSEYNYQAGIAVEKSYGAIVRNNHSEGNGLEDVRGELWLWSPGILVNVSRDVEIYGNTVVNNANGITAVQQNRGSGQFGESIVMNLWVHDNDITMPQGYTGAAQDVGDNSIFTSRNNRFDNNTYHGPASFRWFNDYLSFTEWQGFGMDVNGTHLP